MINLPVSPLLRLFCLCHLLFIPASLARDLHVSGDGNDAADGTTPATAFRTLQKAADLAETGDTVLIGDGLDTDCDDKNAISTTFIERQSHYV